MSSPSAHEPKSPRERRIPSVPSLDRKYFRRPLEAVGFWAGIALPFLYLPLLFAGQLSGPERTAFFALVALHAGALVVGHTYDAGSSD